MWYHDEWTFSAVLASRTNLDIKESWFPIMLNIRPSNSWKANPYVLPSSKLWYFNSRLSHLIQCEPYQGGWTQDWCRTWAQRISSHGSAKGTPKCNYTATYTDNYFTSLRLLQKLKNYGIAGTGTLCANKTDKGPLKWVEKTTKEQRESYDYCTDLNSAVVTVIPNDSESLGLSELVTVASNTANIISKVLVFCQEVNIKHQMPFL